MKIFADGVQVFPLPGWPMETLQTPSVKYDLGRRPSATQGTGKRLFTAALNLAEDRRGGFWLCLGRPRDGRKPCLAADLLTSLPNHGQTRSQAQDQFFITCCTRKRIMDVPSAVLETVARIDGGSFWILNQPARLRGPSTTPGLDRCVSRDHRGAGRTTAAISAHDLEMYLKISEDGLISFFQNGRCIWDI